jgi:hypothetical protein
MGPRKNAMKANVGSYDCAARFIVGCLAMLAANHYHSWWGLLGILPILNAVSGYCPLYAVVGISTTACDEHDDLTASGDQSDASGSAPAEAARIRMESTRARAR